MKIFLIIPLLTVSIASYAHEDFITMRDQGNIHFQHLTGWEDFEIHHRISILLELADQLIKKKDMKKPQFTFIFRMIIQNEIHQIIQLDSANIQNGNVKFVNSQGSERNSA